MQLTIDSAPAELHSASETNSLEDSRESPSGDDQQYFDNTEGDDTETKELQAL